MRLNTFELWALWFLILAFPNTHYQLPSAGFFPPLAKSQQQFFNSYGILVSSLGQVTAKSHKACAKG